jgi:c-di-AMP phosphodiesterase-like protein
MCPNDFMLQFSIIAHIYLSIYTLHTPVQSYTIQALVVLFFLVDMDGKKLEYKGEEALKEIERLTINAGEVQDNLLKQILTQNKETEYLNQYMKSETFKTDLKEFKRCVPVISYEGIFPYIQRIANGEDSSLITGQPITEMLCR